jgi:hypothetical protein
MKESIGKSQIKKIDIIKKNKKKEIIIIIIKRTGLGLY